MTDNNTGTTETKKKKKAHTDWLHRELWTENICPVCKALGHTETLKEVTDLERVSRNPHADKGVPRVVDCTAGCRYGLEPFINPREQGKYFSYMLLRSERDPGAVVNHWWFSPDKIEKG